MNLVRFRSIHAIFCFILRFRCSWICLFTLFEGCCLSFVVFHDENLFIFVTEFLRTRIKCFGHVYVSDRQRVLLKIQKKSCHPLTKKRLIFTKWLLNVYSFAYVSNFCLWNVLFHTISLTSGSPIWLLVWLSMGVAIISTILLLFILINHFIVQLQ